MAENTDRPTGANAYSIYVQRDVEATQVNWSEIAKNLTQGAEAIRDAREAKKQAINDATQKALDDLSKIADTDNQSLGKLLINGSDFSKKTLMENMELLRNGNLDPKDYQLILQGQLDGYKNLSEYVKGADAKYQEAMARLEAGEDGNAIASDLEIAWNEGTFGFGDLKNKRLITNPRNGELVLVELVDDGTGNLVMPDPDKRPDLYQNTAYLNVRSDFKLDRRNTNALADGVVDNLATVITSSVGAFSAIGGGGVVTSIEDFRQMFDNDKMKEFLSLENDDGSAMTYDQFMDDQVSAITGDASDLSSMNAAQVLSGAGYKFVQSAEEAKAKGITKYVIYKNVNGRPEVELTEGQMTEARNIARRAIESRIDLKIKQTQPDTGEQVRPETPTEAGDREKTDKTSAYIRDINKVLTDPDIATSQATLRTLVTNINEQRASGGRPRINDIDITDDTIVVTYESGEPTIIQRTRRDDAGEITGQTTTNEDIGALYQLLVPGAQAEGGDLALSPSQIESFIQREKIQIGDRGVNRNVGYEQDIQAPETLTDQTAVAKADGTTITTNQFWNEKDSTAEDELGEELNAGAIDSDSNIAAVANKYLEQFTTTAASQAQEQAGFSSIRVEVTGDGNGRKAVLKYSVGGVTKEIEVGKIPNGTKTRRYGQMVVDAYNKLNEEAYKARSEKGQTIRPTYNAWLKSKGLDKGNAQLYKQYLEEHPLK